MLMFPTAPGMITRNLMNIYGYIIKITLGMLSLFQMQLYRGTQVELLRMQTFLRPMNFCFECHIPEVWQI